MKFQDIPQFTKTAAYAVDVFWDYLEQQLTHYADSNILELDPEFQRAHVWTPEQQRRDVEYILRGGHSSRDIYFNCANWMRAGRGVIYLVDGKQRMEAVRKFLRDELPIFDGHICSDFEDKLPFSAGFKFHINDLPTYADVLQWYIDLNAGGVAHTSEEIEKVRKLLDAEK